MAGIEGIGAVIFDVDGVLIDTMSFHAAAWVQAGQELGIEVDEEEVYSREGEPGLHTARDFIKSAGMMTTKARAAAFVAKKEEIYEKIARHPKVFPGAKDLLAHLKSLGMPLAFVTGTSREETNKVLPADILEFFTASVCGDEVMRGKPNPEPYMKAMSLLKVTARESLVIENAPYGIQSAKSAGAAVWAVRSYLSDEHLGKSDRLFDSIGDILNSLKR